MPRKYATRRRRARSSKRHYRGGNGAAAAPSTAPPSTGTSVASALSQGTNPMAAFGKISSMLGAKQSGGSAPSIFTSSPSPISGFNDGASGYEIKTVGGTIDAQQAYFDKAYTGSAITGSGPPQNMSGGARRRRHGRGRSSKRRGGNLAGVIGQAVVPFALIGANQRFRRSSTAKNFHRRSFHKKMSA